MLSATYTLHRTRSESRHAVAEDLTDGQRITSQTVARAKLRDIIAGYGDYVQSSKWAETPEGLPVFSVRGPGWEHRLYISKHVPEVEARDALIARIDDQIQDLVVYLSSDKFAQDTTVQVDDVLRRIRHLQLEIRLAKVDQL